MYKLEKYILRSFKELLQDCSYDRECYGYVRPLIFLLVFSIIVPYLIILDVIEYSLDADYLDSIN